MMAYFWDILLQISDFESGLDLLEKEKQVTCEDNMTSHNKLETDIYLSYLHDAEVGIGSDIAEMFTQDSEEPWILQLDTNRWYI